VLLTVLKKACHRDPLVGDPDPDLFTGDTDALSGLVTPERAFN